MKIVIKRMNDSHHFQWCHLLAILSYIYGKHDLQMDASGRARDENRKSGRITKLKMSQQLSGAFCVCVRKLGGDQCQRAIEMFRSDLHKHCSRLASQIPTYSKWTAIIILYNIVMVTYILTTNLIACDIFSGNVRGRNRRRRERTLDYD